MSRRGLILRALLGALCLVCFGWGRGLALEAAKLPDCRVMSGIALTGRQSQEMAEAEAQQEVPLAFTVWGQLDDQGVSEPLLDRYAQVDVLLLGGGSELVFRADTPLQANDLEGCLIDPGTAQTLFGNSRPVGSTVSWEGRELSVRGVLRSDRPLLAVQALDGDMGMDHLSLQVPEGVSPGLASAGFGGRHALYGSWTDTGAWSGLAGFASLLPAAVMLGYVFLKIVKTAFAAAEYPVVFLVCLLAAGAVWMAGMLTMEVSFQIPAELLPAKWSDFEFWGRLWDEKKEDLLTMLAAPKTQAELMRIVPALLACGAGAAGAVLAVMVVAKVRPKSGMGLWLCCAGSLMLAFALSLLMRGELARDRALWLVPTLYFGSRWAADKLAEWSDETTGHSTI